MTGIDDVLVKSEAEREHFQGRAVLWVFARVLADERLFWQDAERVRGEIASVDPAADDAARRLNDLGAQVAKSYGVVRSRDHCVVIALMVFTAAAFMPDRPSAYAALQRLGEGPVRLDGAALGYARHDVTRIVQGAQMVAAYRALRCSMPACKDRWQTGGYCRRHSRLPRRKALEQTRLWALGLAADALPSTGFSGPGDYSFLLFRSRADLACLAGRQNDPDPPRTFGDDRGTHP
jgi:hypothetical protein